MFLFWAGHFIGPPFYKLVLYGSKMTRDTLVVDIDPEHGTPRGPAVVLPVRVFFECF
jgi:hypothetical protein